MDDPVFKSKYQKYKYKVKLWEKSFRQINGRIPSKHDIREAPLNIRDAYKMYFKLKSSFLEDTLNDVLDEDGFDLSLADSSQLDASVANSSALSDYNAADGGTEGAPSLPTLGDISAATTNAARGSLETSANTTAGSSGSGPSFSNIDELPPMALSNLRNVDENHVLTEFEAEEHENADIVAINAKAWGTHLNRSSASSSEPKKVATSQEAVRKVVTEKLFRNASFSKRNPRKSLSTRGIGAVAADGLLPGSQLRPQNLLPDLETILMEKARKQNEQELVQSAAPKQTGPATVAVATASNTLRAVVDQGWLNRCSAANGEVSGAGERSTTPAAQSQPVKFGMSNLNVPLLQPAADSAATVGPSVKETYAQNTYADELLYGDDYEEVIENSEDEGTASAKATSTRHVLKKRKVHDFRPIAAVTVAKAEEETPIVSDATTENQSARGIKKVDEKTPRPKAAKRTVKLKTSPKLTSTPSVSVVRRSTRAVRRCAVIPATAETDGAVVDDDDFEADATDSDADPEFNPSTDGKKGTPQAASDSSSDDEKENPSKTSRKSSLKTATVNRKSAAPGKHKPTDIVDGADEAEADGPQDYVLEFGTDYTVSVPRVDVAELQANTEAFQDYVYDINPIKSAAQSRNDAIHIPLTKREMERAKLETRIEAGKLNENFVRINIQKKKFVRGHKTTNFSKYKKSEWRKIKVANALAGPEMNMNGCDGGFLLCFQCGQQGHFASDCKMQSDRLLPLSADVEVSEFPTLAEVERMADEKRLRAYERRPAAQASADEQHAEQQTESDEADDDRDENELTRNDELLPAGVQKSAKAGGQRANFLGHQIPAEFLKLAGYDADTVANSDAIRPLYDLDADGNVRPPTDEVLAALRQFGHTSFRKGQDRAVMRVLSGQPTLVTLSTGSGKSLCYQLPAYMYRQQRRQCITLVISPLVSLMEDQVHDVPHFLNAQCLHTGQTKAVRERIMAAIRSGVVDVLLISPEAVVAGERATGFGSLLRELPPIAFACIDEAHCMSQWSHNFRPSYLMICRVLQEKLKVHTVLGLTATATRTTRESIVRHLAIPDGMRGVISDVPLPGNLLLTVSSEANRDQGLVRLLRSEQFAAFRSIIVYCTRRDECERVAGVIRMCFQDEEKQLREDSAAAALAAGGGATKKRMRTKSLVECYHAGLAASRRKKIQNEFMRSDLKIVVATIAFGMGINKADIRAVIHYNMPMTYENYTQEVGRAGRDGQPSHCHLFLDSNRKDLVELRRHVYANSIDRHVIRKLLQKVFVSCACEHNLQLKEYQSDVDAVQNMSWTDDMHDDDADVENQTTAARPLAVATAPTHVRRKCPGHENCFSVEKTVQALDIPEENIATLLCYLELHEQRYIQVLSRAYCVCKVMSYGGAGVLKAAARTCTPLAMAIALDLKRGISHHQSTLIQFQVVDVAAAIGWDSGIVKHQLKNLEWTNVNGQPKRSSISIEFSDLGFRVRSPGDLSDAELDTMLDMMYGRVTGQERMQLLQLQNVFNGLSAVAFDSCALAIKQPEEAEGRSDKLKVHIRDYFQRDGIDETIEIVELKDTKEVTDDQIENDVRTMMARYPDNQFTGRTLARIFHGVASPVYPAQIWFRCNFWRTHTRVDFNRIVTLANAVIVRCRRS